MSSEVLPKNDNRVALIFIPEKSADRNYWINFGQDAVLNSGFGVVLNGGNFLLTRELIGPEITMAVSAIAIGAGTFGVLEICESNE